MSTKSWELHFSDAWRACLNTSPRLRYFKMNEAAGLSGQFHKWAASARDEKLRALAKIINSHAKIVTYSTIDLDAHAETWAKLPKPLSDPYFWPFQNTIADVCLTLWDSGWRERFEIIFDEQLIFGPRAHQWYPVLRDVLKYREPDASLLLPDEPVFRTDDESLPLQAADLFAWCWRRGTNQEVRPFEWLLEELRNVFLSEYAQFYTRERMTAVLADSEAKSESEFVRTLAPKFPEHYPRIRRSKR